MLNLFTRLLLPTEITIKKNALARLRYLEGRRCMILCGQGALKNLGHLDKARASLEKAKLEIGIYEGIKSDPTFSSVKQCANAIAQFKPDWIIAMGGGSVIDTAKLACVFYEHPEITWENIIKPFSIPALQKKTKLIAIPTTSGSGSEVSISAVVIDDQTNKKHPIVSPELLPNMVILDPILTLELPRSITACTAIDALTHAFESFCSKLHNALTDIYAVTAGNLIVKNLQTAIESPTLQERENLMYAAMLAGQAQNITSVGAVHALSHTIGAEFKIPHGLANALFLGPIAEINAKNSERPLQFIEKIGFHSLLEFSNWIRHILLSADLPLRWEKAIHKDSMGLIDPVLLAQKAKQDICMSTNPIPLSVEELTDVLNRVR